MRNGTSCSYPVSAPHLCVLWFFINCFVIRRIQCPSDSLQSSMNETMRTKFGKRMYERSQVAHIPRSIVYYQRVLDIRNEGSFRCRRRPCMHGIRDLVGTLTRFSDDSALPFWNSLQIPCLQRFFRSHDEIGSPFLFLRTAVCSFSTNSRGFICKYLKKEGIEY